MHICVGHNLVRLAGGASPWNPPSDRAPPPTVSAPPQSPHPSPQLDVHNSFSTVQEALEFSAALRLPSSVTPAQRAAFVGEVRATVCRWPRGGRGGGDHSVRWRSREMRCTRATLDVDSLRVGGARAVFCHPHSLRPALLQLQPTQILDLLELRAIATRKVGEVGAADGLSPGQRKILTIGVELCSNAPIIFLDEPTSGLVRAELVEEWQGRVKTV